MTTEERFENIEKLVALNKSAIDDVNSCLLDVKSFMSEAKSDIGKIKSSIDILLKNTASNKSDIDEVASNLKATEEGVDFNASKTASCEKVVSEFSSALEEKEKRIVSCEAMINKFKIDINNMLNTVEKSNLNIVSAVEKLNSVKDGVEKSRNEVSEMDKKIAASKRREVKNGVIDLDNGFTANVSCSKTSGVANVCFDDLRGSKGGEVVVATLPFGFRPKNEFVSSADVDFGEKSIVFKIKIDGQVVLYNYLVGRRIRFSATFICGQGE